MITGQCLDEGSPRQLRVPGRFGTEHFPWSQPHLETPLLAGNRGSPRPNVTGNQAPLHQGPSGAELLSVPQGQLCSLGRTVRSEHPATELLLSTSTTFQGGQMEKLGRDFQFDREGVC